MSTKELKRINIVSWNVNGLRASIRSGGFAKFVKRYQPDILCLQEIKARPDQVQPDLKGYREYWNPADRPGYAGTAIFCRQKPLALLFDLPPVIEETFRLAEDPFGNANREGRVLAAEFDWGWIVSVYVPNSKRELTRLLHRCEQWEPAFLAFLQALEQGRYGTGTPKPVIFCGDLNVAHEEIDLARPRENRCNHGFTDEERGCFRKLLSHGFVDTFRHLFPETTGAYTWWSYGKSIRERNIGWRIDYIVASATLADRIASAAIHADTAGSDHVPVSAEIIIG